MPAPTPSRAYSSQRKAIVAEAAASQSNADRKAGVRAARVSAVAWIDLSMLTLSLLATTIASYRFSLQTSLSAFLGMRISVRNLGLALGCLILWRIALWISGVYRTYSFKHLASRLLVATTLCTVISCLAFMQRATGGGLVRPTMLFWLLSTVSMFAVRGVLALAAGYAHAHTREVRRVIIVGSGIMAQKLAGSLREHPQWDYHIYGFVDSDPRPRADEMLGPHLGTLDTLSDLLMHTPVDEVFIGLPLRSHYEEIQRAIDLCESAGIQSQYQANIFSTSVTKKLHADEGRIVMRMVHYDSRRFLKRTFDFIAASVGIVLISPLLLAVAILIKLTSKGPVLFKQTRFGLNKHVFQMYKFRSMVTDAEELQAALEHLNETSGPVFKIKSDPRVTRIGTFIRKTSIDELPQLFNVIRGDMSLVGPRPLPTRDVSRFSELSLMRRFSVKPGMTGLWQVSGRSNVDFDGWIELDLRYIDHWSLMLDFQILAKTVPAVLKGRGAT